MPSHPTPKKVLGSTSKSFGQHGKVLGNMRKFWATPFLPRKLEGVDTERRQSPPGRALGARWAPCWPPFDGRRLSGLLLQGATAAQRSALSHPSRRHSALPFAFAIMG